MSESIIKQQFDTIEFLKIYKQHPCLWDKALPDFRNRKMRDAAEEKLLPISKLSNIKELRSKIRSIRGTYNQEVNKIHMSMKTGCGKKDIYIPKLNWFSYADSFLRKNFEQYVETQLNLILNDEFNTDGTSQICNNEEHKVTKYMPDQDLSFQIQQKKRPLQNRNILKSSASKLLKINNSLDEAVKVLREVSSSSSSSRCSNNEFTVFGQLVASQLAQNTFRRCNSSSARNFN
uniref:ACYPI009600 protein n=1 Tax=Acyrthosiphon pisum TaxID=7029 RepID=C4WT25_ACYPI|nr:ACYPI009600 [Acyrthosiphon pisum]